MPANARLRSSGFVAKEFFSVVCGVGCSNGMQDNPQFILRSKLWVIASHNLVGVAGERCAHQRGAVDPAAQVAGCPPSMAQIKRDRQRCVWELKETLVSTRRGSGMASKAKETKNGVVRVCLCIYEERKREKRPDAEQGRNQKTEPPFQMHPRPIGKRDRK